MKPACNRLLTLFGILWFCIVESAIADPTVLTNIPSYNWYHGCGPTAAASIIAYWDLHGYPDFSVWENWNDIRLTSNVQDEISSPEHNAKYDPKPDADGPDPEDTSIADFLHTSEGDLNFGATDRLVVPGGLEDYAAYKGYQFVANNYYFVENPTVWMGQFHWNEFTAEIDAGRPMIFHVDSTGDGSYDHIIPVFGYDDRGVDGLFYGCYTNDSYTGDEDEIVAWKEFREVASGNPWGVSAATFFSPDPPNTEPPLVVDLIDFTTSVAGENILLTWSTASEMNHAGFHIWRSDGADGIFERLTKELIPSQGSTLSGADYSWLDEMALIDTDCHYKLESIDAAGESRFYGPVVFSAVVVQIDNLPEGPQIIEQGVNSPDYTVSGGEGPYAWTVTDRMGATVDTAAGASYSFKAPQGMASAGEYTVAVVDNNGFSDSFTVKVPMAVDPHVRVLTALKLDGTDNGLDFSVNGAAGDYVWEILSSEMDAREVSVPEKYGTWAKGKNVSNDITNRFLPNPVINEITTFYVRVTALNDPDLTEANGLYQRIAGPFTIIPLDVFTVNVSGNDGLAITGAVVNVDYTDPDTGNKVEPKTTGENGDAAFTLPSTGGTYAYSVSAEGFISREVSSQHKMVAVTLDAAAGTISGTVQDAAGAALAGAAVEVFHPDNFNFKDAGQYKYTERYTDVTDAAGSFRIALPPWALANGYTVVAKKAGYVSGRLENVANGADDADFTAAAGRGLVRKTIIKDISATAADGKVKIVFKADPEFTHANQAVIEVLEGSGVMEWAENHLDPQEGNVLSNWYSLNENFTVLIKADTIDDGVTHYDAILYTYTVDANVKAGQGDAGGGEVDLSDAALEAVGRVPASGLKINVPPGGIEKDDYTVIGRFVPKNEDDSKWMEMSPTLFEVQAIDNDTFDEVPASDIRKIKIPLLIDLSVIGAGDIEEGRFKIVHNATKDGLDLGNGTVVPTDQIISTDYIGDGTFGSVTFCVDSLSYFGIQSSTGAKSLAGSSESSGAACFVNSAQHAAGSGGSALGSILLLVLICLACEAARKRTARR